MPIDSQEETTANWMKEAKKGYIRVAVLILVNKKPSHGYEIMKEIRERTKGFWKPTAGGVYPVLRSLEEAGYIEGRWAEKRNREIKIYHITESGKQILTRTLVKQGDFTANLNALAREFARDVLNIEGADFPFQAMTSPFRVFLEEESQRKEDSLELMERKRDHIANAIKMLKEELDGLEREIAKLKK
jgi:DNA-binding PadR family transcriptional regulator